jgi:hypothetical protein
LGGSIHLKIAENTNRGGAHNVRATCWQIHPITTLQVLDSPPPGARELRPELLAQLQKARGTVSADTPATPRMDRKPAVVFSDVCLIMVVCVQPLLALRSGAFF